MDEFLYKNYDRCIVNLMSSIQQNYHVLPSHTTLPEADRVLAKKEFKNVIVMVFDAMGQSILDYHSKPHSFLKQHNISTFHSVIPSTTAAATTSYLTALTPIETGWLGWSLYMDEIDKNVDIFTSVDSLTKEYVGVNCGDTYLPYTCVGKQIVNQNENVKYYEIWPSFRLNGCKNLKEVYKKLLKLCRNDEKKFIYVYWSQPDHDMHDFGPYHKKVTKHIKKINKISHKLFKKTTDTAAFISADHGQVEVAPILLYTYYELMNCLQRLPSLDSRCTSFKVKKGYDKRFISLFEKYFSGKFILLSKKEALKKNIFGIGKEHEKADSILGDYIAFAIDKYFFASTPDFHPFKGHHAGILKDEMLIPFITFDN